MRPEWVGLKTPMPDLDAWPLTGIKRFDQKISPNESGCWIWTGKDDGRDGYGRAFIGDKWRPAHRVVYELRVGPIPDGLTIDHLCRVRNCVNPEHLEPVTVRENTLRGIGPSAMNARKKSCPKGHKLDAAQADGRRYCTTCHREYHSVWGIQRRKAARCGAPTTSGECRRDIADGKLCPYHPRININGEIHILTAKAA